MKLDWKKPQVEWLSDKRPAVVKRAIDTLAKVGNVARLKEAKARKSALWSLNRIPGSRPDLPSALSSRMRIQKSG